VSSVRPPYPSAHGEGAGDIADAPSTADSLRHGAHRNGPISRAARWLRSVYECAIFYGSLVLFGLICLTWSLPATLLYPFLPRKIAAPLGQFVIMAAFRFFVTVIRTSGIVKCDLSALDTLQRDSSIVIAPNHPSLLDAVLIISRLPRAVCIMKAKIWDNPFLGGGARLAGYIRNDTPVNMVKRAAKELGAGSQLLVFPEGTRTVHKPIDAFKGGFAVIAKKAAVPVQTVFIESNSAFLGKTWSFFRKPEFPLIYQVRLGRRFEVGSDVQGFLLQLERYYRDELTRQEARPESP
jgi:1-acyl-sn-glycerol-3-phosphate acyltransferase